MYIGCDLFSSSIKFQRIDKLTLSKIKKKIKSDKIIEVIPEKREQKNLDKVEIYWGNRINSNLIKKMPNLKWIHFASTGINKDIYEQIKKKKIKVTNTQNLYSSAVSSTVLSFIFSLARGTHYCNFLRAEKKLNRFHFDKISNSIQDVYFQSILIVGLGEIGNKIAKVCNSLGMKIFAIKKKSVMKKPKYVKKIFQLKKLKKAVSGKDYIVNLLPVTNKTKNIFNKNIFNSMKKNSIFINVGRGGTVNERDLLKVLKKNRISGAGLDVMVNEPISMKSSFLKLKNVIITPHIAGVTNNFWDKQISLFFENLIRYKRNSNLQYLKNFSNIKEGY